MRPEYTSDAPHTKSGVEGDSEPFDPLRQAQDGLRQAQGRLRSGQRLGVVDVVRGVEAEEAILVEVESVVEDVQVSHAAYGGEDLLFGPA